MKNNLIVYTLIPLIVACTPSAEKAKELGFSSASEMTSLNEMGYKTYADFEKVHPFVVPETTTTKFAGAELGKPALKYSEKIETFERPQMYKTGRDVYIDTSWNDEKTIKRITFNCKLSKSEKVKLGSVDCSSTEEDLKAMKLKTLCDVFSEESPEDPVFYIKDKSFYSTNTEGKVQWLGIASEDHFDKDWSGGEVPSKLIACSAVSSWKANAANGGFKTVYEMDEAAKAGIKTAQEWIKEQAKKKFKSKYDNSTNALERALVVLVSTQKEFQSHKDDGGLNVLSSWRGYQMQSAEVEYTAKVLTLFHVVVDSDYKNPNKPVTVNNLKRDLIDECGIEWKPNYGGDAYFSNSEFSRCEISPSRNGGYHVVVSVKSNRSD